MELRLQRLAVCLAAALAALAFVSLPAAAQSTTAMQEHFGELSYRLYCSGCHGPDGRGSEPASRALGLSTGDLTLLRRGNGGVFPSEDLTAALSGLAEIEAHRILAMHPWAEMFAEDFARFAAEAAVNPMVARRIAHLVAYIESLQR